MGELRRVIFIGVCISFISILIFNACDSQRTVAIEDSLEFIRSIEPIEEAQNVTIDLRDGHAQDAYFLVDLSNIKSNQFIGNGTKEAWCIEWDISSLKGEQRGVKLHSTKGQELWSDVNYFLSTKDELKAEYPDLGWKESQIILWALVKHKDFNIDAIPSYQNFSNHFYKDGEFLFDVDMSKKIITQVKAADPGAEYNSYAIILENDGQTVIIDGEDVPVGSAEVGPEGGKIVSEDGNFLLEIPSGAVDKEVVISIEEEETLFSRDEYQTEDFNPISKNYKVSPSNLKFEKDIVVQMKYDNQSVDANLIEVMHLAEDLSDGGPIDYFSVIESQGIIEFETNHFSFFYAYTTINELTFRFYWDLSEINYFIKPDDSGYLWSDESLIANVVDGIEDWEEHLNGRKLTRVFDESKANIIVETIESCLGNCKGRINKYITWWPKKLTEDDQIRVQINAEENENNQSYYSYDKNLGLEKLVLHEVGHALGLSHNRLMESSREPKGVPAMWVPACKNCIDIFNEFEREITGDEIAALEYKYEETLTKGDWPRDTETDVVDVYNPITGRTWMDRNLGASRAATSPTDEQAYGDLYQWGRPADGHQKRNSGTTTSLSNSDQPGHGDFIISNVENSFDWRSERVNDLWQGSNGINNPCPESYRLPTRKEWEVEIESWTTTDSDGAFSSPLRLPKPGLREYTGRVSLTNSGRYWSSSVPSRSSSNHLAGYLGVFDWDASSNGSTARARGATVRCIKD